MRQIILTLALATLASLFSFEAGAKPVPKLAEKAKADDLAALQGEWVVASVVAPDGVQQNAEQTLTIKKDEWVQPNRKMLALTFKIDATKLQSNWI